MMIDAISTTRSLPWPRTFPEPRRRSRLLAPGTRGRAAARHGLRGALQAICLCAVLMAGAGVVGASRGPVELNEPAPAQAGSTWAMQVVPAAPASGNVSVGLAERVTTR